MEYFRNHENTTEDMFVNREIPSHLLAYYRGKEVYRNFL